MVPAVPISLSVYFLRLKFKLGSRGTGVGYKIPTAETLGGIDSSTAPPGLLREPGSTADSRTAPPGLLREPGSPSDLEVEASSLS